MSESSRFYVSQYNVTRHYGGPEEGGWWYDWEDFDAVVAEFSDVESAREYCRGINAEFGGSDRYSVNGGGDVEYNVETLLGEYQTTERPHYC